MAADGSAGDLSATLGRFLDRTDRLRECAYVSNPDACRWGLKWERHKGTTFTIQQPSEDLTKSFLVDLRPLISERESIFVNRICNLCEAHLKHDEWREWLRQSRRYWREALSSGQIRLVMGSMSVAPEEILDLWVNGFYFHDDPDKRRRLDTLNARVPFLARYNLHAVLEDTSRHVFYVAKIVRAGVGEGLFDVPR